MKKMLYVVLDGLGDVPVKALGGKTPLEAAFTPNMDRLAQSGKSGVVHTVAKGIAPESDIAVISLLGYDIHKYHTGRGPLEAFAEGLDVREGNVALRVNFASGIDDGRTIVDRRVGRGLTTEEATLLAQEVNAKVTLTNATFELKSTVGHRGVLVLRGMHSRLSAGITNTDPAYGREGFFGVAREKFDFLVQESRPLPGREKDKAALEAAALLNEFTAKAHMVLQEVTVNKKRVAAGRLPANILLARDAGDRLPHFPPFREHHGVVFGSFVEMPVEKGIALLTGMEVVLVPARTGHPDVDYAVWAKMVLKKIAAFDGLTIHIKGPDEPGHDGDVMRKKVSIELIDKYFFGSLLPDVPWEDTLIVVTADHAIPCALRVPSADPVPLVFAGGGVRPDGTMSFSERACAEGSLGAVCGRDLMGLFIKTARI